MASTKQSSNWWGVTVALLVGLILGFSACKFNWLRPIGFAGESITSASNSSVVFKQELQQVVCPVCPVCELSCKAPEDWLLRSELSCFAPDNWLYWLDSLKKPLSKKPVARVTKPQVSSAPAAETKPATPDLATAIQNAPAASKRPDSKTYVNELPKVSGCVRQTKEGEVKC